MTQDADMRIEWKDGEVTKEMRIEDDSINFHYANGEVHHHISLDRHQMRQMLRLLEIWDEGNI